MHMVTTTQVEVYLDTLPICNVLSMLTEREKSCARSDCRSRDMLSKTWLPNRSTAEEPKCLLSLSYQKSTTIPPPLFLRHRIRLVAELIGRPRPVSIVDGGPLVVFIQMKINWQCAAESDAWSSRPPIMTSMRPILVRLACTATRAALTADGEGTDRIPLISL